jgi:hypothetical protein
LSKRRGISTKSQSEYTARPTVFPFCSSVPARIHSFHVNTEREKTLRKPGISRVFQFLLIGWDVVLELWSPAGKQIRVEQRESVVYVKESDMRIVVQRCDDER